MLGHAASDMSEVMLDREHWQTQMPLRRVRGSVIGVQITHRKNRRLRMQLDQILGRPCVGRARLDRFEIADMLAQDRTACMRQRDRALEVAAKGENAGPHALQPRPAPARNPAPAAAAALARTTTRATESSTGRTIGRSWTRNKSAIPPSRSSASLSSEHDRLVADIAAGGDHREIEIAHQQMMQRRIGQ